MWICYSYLFSRASPDRTICHLNQTNTRWFQIKEVPSSVWVPKSKRGQCLPAIKQTTSRSVPSHTSPHALLASLRSSSTVLEPHNGAIVRLLRMPSRAVSKPWDTLGWKNSAGKSSLLEGPLSSLEPGEYSEFSCNIPLACAQGGNFPNWFVPLQGIYSFPCKAELSKWTI